MDLKAKTRMKMSPITPPLAMGRIKLFFHF